MSLFQDCNPSILTTMIQHQVSSAMENLKARKEEGSNKEANQIEKIYKELIESKPGPFYGDEGVNGLIHWIKDKEIKLLRNTRLSLKHAPLYEKFSSSGVSMSKHWE